MTPYSARLGREAKGAAFHEPAQLLMHEDTVRAVYKKHAQNFFEEIKEGFLREAATLRKQAQKALPKSPAPPDAEVLDSGVAELHQQVSALQRQVTYLESAASAAKPPAAPTEEPGAGKVSPSSNKSGAPQARAHRDPSVELAKRLDRQQEELRNLSRHVQSEFSTAKKAALTPMWKERALQEIAQGELRGVCADEVSRAFKELSSSLSDQEVEAALVRLAAVGPLPGEVQLRTELEDLREKSTRELAELSHRADESTAARAVVVERCDSLEERQRAGSRLVEGVLERIKGLNAHIDDLESRLDTTAAKLSERCEELEQRQQEVRQGHETQHGDFRNELEDRCAELEARSKTLESSLAEQRDGHEERCRVLERGHSALAASVGQRCSQVETDLEESCQRLFANLKDRCGKIESRHDDWCAQLKLELQDLRGSFGAGLEEKCRKLEAEAAARMADAARFGAAATGLVTRLEVIEEAATRLRAGLEAEASARASDTTRLHAATSGLAMRVEAAEARSASAAEASNRTQLASEAARRLAEAAVTEARAAHEAAAAARAVAQRPTSLDPELRQLREGCAGLASEVRGAQAEASAAGAAAARARAEAEGARGLASGLAEAVAGGEAAAAHHATRLVALEGRSEEHRRQAERLRGLEAFVEDARRQLGRLATIEGRQEELQRGARRLDDGLGERFSKLAEQLEHLAESSTRHAARLSGAESQLEALRNVARRMPAVEAAEAARRNISSEEAPDRAYITARLAAHLESVEARVQSLPRRLEALGDEVSTQARRQAETGTKHGLRLEALEDKACHLKQQVEDLVDEVGSQGRKLTDNRTQHALDLEALEGRVASAHGRAEALGMELGFHTRKLADTGGQMARSGALEELSGHVQTRTRPGDRLASRGASLEEARPEVGSLSPKSPAARVGKAEEEPLRRRPLAALEAGTYSPQRPPPSGAAESSTRCLSRTSMGTRSDASLPPAAVVSSIINLHVADLEQSDGEDERSMAADSRASSPQ